VLYGGSLAAFLMLHVRPMVTATVGRGDALLLQYSESRTRAGALVLLVDAVARTRDTSPRPVDAAALDSLETLETRIDAIAAVVPVGAAVTDGAESPLNAAVRAVWRLERSLIEDLRATVIALHAGDRRRAQESHARAFRGASELQVALANATDASLAEYHEQGATLLALSVRTSHVVLLWFLLGLLAVPVLGRIISARLYRPLNRLDLGLARLSSGDLSARVDLVRDDELGRLGHHFNLMADSLRARAAFDRMRQTNRSVERTRRILAAALDAVVVVDGSGCIREWNPQAASLFGWPRSQALGVRLGSLLFPSPDGDTAARTRVEAVISGDVSPLQQRTRVSARRADGSDIPVEFGISRLEAGESGDDAECEEYAVFVRDLRSEAAAHHALAESETRYRAAFEQAAVGIIEIAPSGRLLRLNPAGARIIGVTQDELVGVPFTDLFDAAAARDHSSFAALVRGEVPHVQHTRAYRRPDGNNVFVDLTATPVRGPDGSLSYVFVTLKDVSDQARLEAELRQSQKLDAVGQLAGGVAHDFNNILAGIMGFADLLEHEAGDHEAVRVEARAIVATARRGADLAQKLLSLSRKVPTALDDVRVRDVINEVHEIIKRAFDRNIEISLDAGDCETQVRADRTQLSNAALNLALNARDAMPDGGRLTFRCRRVRLDAAAVSQLGAELAPGAYVAISVADTGAGMCEETRRRIFEPFFTTKPAGKGTGLGLSMVYAMVRAHAGHITVESRLGAGSRFTLYLPALTSAAEHRPAATPPPLVRGSGCVLVADDETTVREVVTRMLRRLGYTVDAVADGEHAVARFRQRPDDYAFVVLDGDMPRMAGRHAGRAIREIRPDVKLFLASGYRRSVTDDELVGFTAVLSKPFTLAELSRAVAEHTAPIATVN
jgi:PAS domain S-box-containing protein